MAVSLQETAIDFQVDLHFVGSPASVDPEQALALSPSRVMSQPQDVLLWNVAAGSPKWQDDQAALRRCLG
jgi:hypothetical protein